MTEPVDFSIAKLLKEKEFDITTNYFHNIDGDLYKPMFNSLDILAPTIAEVVMWLYKKHNIWIEVRRSYLLDKFVAITKNPRRELSACTSPEEAYEKAIEYTLKNLI